MRLCQSRQPRWDPTLESAHEPRSHDPTLDRVRPGTALAKYGVEDRWSSRAMGAVVRLRASGAPNDFEFTASFATQRLRRVRAFNLQALEIFGRHITGHIL